MVITNRVFDSSLDLRQTLFDDPFNNRLKEIITSDLSEIQENAQKLLLKSIEETLGEKSIDFSITSSIWQTGQEDQEKSHTVCPGFYVITRAWTVKLLSQKGLKFLRKLELTFCRF